jgi:hypothetical protein
MAIARTFSANTIVGVLPDISNSLGSHIGAKLEAFASDERTLTDEFCDMTCIWAESAAVAAPSGPSAWAMPITLDIQKMSAQAEVVIGADLELVVRSPLGAKRLLAQAKVLDPQDLRLRCDSVSGWEKLRQQLAKCRTSAGSLACLLVYVPEGELSGSRYAFSTWEQRYPPQGTGADLRFGTTFISVDSLLDSQNGWRSTPPLRYVGGGRFQPAGASFTRVLFELLSCAKGNWGDIPPSKSMLEVREDGQGPYRVLDVRVGAVEPGVWNELLVPHFQEYLARLRETGDTDAA